MRSAWLAIILASVSALLFSGEGKPQAVSLDYAKAPGLLAAAYAGGQVVVWESESGRVLRQFNTALQGSTRSQPLARFSPDGRHIAFTAEGETGLQVVDLESGASTPIVPHRMLYKGIAAFTWSHQKDTLLIAIGRDIVLFSASGRREWQRRLETRSLITDVVWHPSERLYTVVTDDTVVSSYETISGRVIASAALERASHPSSVKISWSPDGFSLAAVIRGGSLALLDPESLKITKMLAGNCADFAWTPARNELAAAIPPNMSFFSESGQRGRELRTQLEDATPVLWADEGRILTASSDGSIALRDARSGKILKTFLPSAEKLALR